MEIVYEFLRVNANTLFAAVFALLLVVLSYFYVRYLMDWSARIGETEELKPSAKLNRKLIKELEASEEKIEGLRNEIEGLRNEADRNYGGLEPDRQEEERLRNEADLNYGGLEPVHQEEERLRNETERNHQVRELLRVEVERDRQVRERLRVEAERDRQEVERTGEEVFVPLHYATDRTVTGNTEPNHYYGWDRGELRYGRALVSIPKVHSMGQIERPTILRFEISENAQKHIILRDIEEMDKAQFFEDLALEVARLQEKAAFVFIHGFNVTFAEAVRRAAQMAYDLFLVGHERGEVILSIVPILYSWPSKGETILYPHDSNNAQASVAHLKAFLEDVAARSDAESITIIAHSMGSRTLTAALNEVGLEMREGDGPVVKEIVLAAPDIDRDVFLNVAAAVKRTAERVTLYASSRDKALQISKALNGSPRLGDATDEVVVFEGGDSIDASAVGGDILAHSYYGETSVLADLYHLILHGVPPDRRFGLLSQGAPPGRYWIMRGRAGM